MKKDAVTYEPAEGQWGDVYFYVEWYPDDQKMVLYKKNLNGQATNQAEKFLCGSCHKLNEALDEMKQFIKFHSEH